MGRAIKNIISISNFKNTSMADNWIKSSFVIFFEAEMAMQSNWRPIIIIIIIVVKGLFSASTKTVDATCDEFSIPPSKLQGSTPHLVYAFCYSPLWLIGIQQSLHSVGGFATDIT